MKQASKGESLSAKIDDDLLLTRVADLAYANFQGDYAAALKELLTGLIEGF